jgi:hypothetical protein
MLTLKFIVQYADERYYRDRDRQPRHFQHNATRLSLSKARTIAGKTNGKVLPYSPGPATLGS